MRPSWSVVIFLFNEKQGLPVVFSQVESWLTSTNRTPFEIIIVDDGSSDGSGEIAEGLAKRPNVKLVRHPRNLGIGEALLSGYKAATNDYVTAVPADGQFSIAELEAIKTLRDDEFVSFCRVEQLGYSTWRKTISKANKLLNRILLGLNLKDVNWVKVYQRKHLALIPLKIRSSIVESELCAKLIANGVVPTEIPSAYRPRLAGHSKAVKLNVLIRAGVEYLRLVVEVLRYRLGAATGNKPKR